MIQIRMMRNGGERRVAVAANGASTVNLEHSLDRLERAIEKLSDHTAEHSAGAAQRHTDLIVILSAIRENTRRWTPGSD